MEKSTAVVNAKLPTSKHAPRNAVLRGIGLSGVGVGAECNSAFQLALFGIQFNT
jgi:hypothetical protein